MPQLRRITLKLCQVALHIKNSVFIIYLLEDEQELSLGMLIRLQRIYNFWLLHAILYYPFWMFMGFTLHLYIIFGTNLLTGGPAQIAVFCLFQSFTEKEYQTESKRNETFGSVIFGTNVIQTWSASQEAAEAAMRVEGVPTPTGRAPYLVGPSGSHRPTSSSYIYPCTPTTSREPTKT